MNKDNFSSSRRSFLKTTMTLPVAIAAAPGLFTPKAAAAEATGADALPRRQLGKAGPHVTMLCMGGMMTARSTANLLTRTTAILAGCFMFTSITLAIMAGHHNAPTSNIDTGPAADKPALPTDPAPAPAAPAEPAAPAKPAAPEAQ